MQATDNVLNWTIDSAHSDITFSIKHLGISTVSGSFTQFQGSMIATDAYEIRQVSFEAAIDSLSTGNAQRDEHLKGPDFFDSIQFPTLHFSSVSIEKVNDVDYRLTGDLTLKGRTKSIKLLLEYGGTATDAWGNVKAGFEVAGTIQRKEFGLVWDALTEAGGLMVSNEVSIHGNIQLSKQPHPATNPA
jgi:polyisoprenoid-binding protein YceI